MDSTYNIIETCFERCQECYGPDDTDLIQNCKSCKDGYFLKYNSTNCIPECGEYYYQDSVTKTCINCKKENKYKFKNRNECIDKPDNTIVINKNLFFIPFTYPFTNQLLPLQKQENFFPPIGSHPKRVYLVIKITR